MSHVLSQLPAWVGSFVLVLVAVSLLSDLRADGDHADDRIDDLREQYVTGDIDLDEYERRVGVYLDPEAERIRDLVEDVDGIGPETSLEVAVAFDGVDELREADREVLEDVPLVGEQRAAAIAGV